MSALVVAAPDIEQPIRSVFESVGWEMRSCAGVRDAMVTAVEARPSLVLIDARKDVPTSAQLCRSLRSIEDLQSSCIFALAEDRRDEKLSLLEAGVEDCWTEAPSSREFRLRLEAIDRRLRPDRPKRVLRLRGIELDPDRYTVRTNGVPVQLSAMRMKVLKHFMEHPGVTFSRQELLEQVWENPQLDEGAVTACITRIRRALVAAGGNDVLRTVATGGYVLELNAVSAPYG